MKLGALKKVPLREVWKNEAADFSKWLASKEGLELLSESVGVDLELIETESSVGSKRVDVLAKISGSDQVAVIENQIEDSNHDHLGKLITYAAGKNATCAIWIVKEAADVHRRAIEFLNQTSKGSIGYFLLEIEAWKIGDSDPAPKFNVVESPNDWARTEDDDSLTDNAKTCLGFWTTFCKEATANADFCKVLKVRKAFPQNWMDFSVGHTDIWLSASVSSYYKRVSVSLCVGPKFAKRDLVLGNQAAIAKGMGAEPKVGSGQIRTFKISRTQAFDLSDEKSWKDAADWICDGLIRYKGVLEGILADGE